MLERFIRELFYFSSSQLKNKKSLFWFVLILLFTFFYSYLFLQQAFQGEYRVQDDARQHVFWMLRFVDPQLFPNDVIADYFQSVAPIGYRNLYQLAANLGIDPFIFNKIIPPFICLVSIIYFFLICLAIFSFPSAAFISTLLFLQSIWIKDDVSSGTARAFLYPFFLAFIYYLLKKQYFPTALALLLMGLFYPQYLLICALILIIRIFDISNCLKFQVKINRNNYRFCLIFLVFIFCILLPYALQKLEFGPVFTATEAQQLTIFSEKGRARFFVKSPWEYWLTGIRSGLLPGDVYRSSFLCIGVFLPLIMKFPDRFPYLKKIDRNLEILWQLLLSSVLMFILAHGTLFKFYLPSRYTSHNLRIVLCIAAGTCIFIVIDSIWHWVEQNNHRNLLKRKLIALTFICILATLILGYYPLLVKKYPKISYLNGNYPTLYQFLAQQPKNITIASLTNETSFLSSLSRRSVLVSYEHSVPYHKGYYEIFSKRTIDLIVAQYNTELGKLSEFIREYKIDFWLLDLNAFNPEYIRQDPWLKQYREVSLLAAQQLEKGSEPAILKFKNSCEVWGVDNLKLLSTKCIINSSK